MKYIPAEKLIAEIERLYDIAREASYNGEIEGEMTAYDKILSFITSLQQEQPDNEDIDKVAQELYEHLYELKRRNNVPTNLYDKKEIIDLWKAGVEYGRNHPNKEQPDFPTTDEEVENALASIPKVELPDKYKTPDWLFKQQDQPEVDFERAYKSYMKSRKDDLSGNAVTVNMKDLAHYFWNKGLNARKEDIVI